MDADLTISHEYVQHIRGCYCRGHGCALPVVQRSFQIELVVDPVHCEWSSALKDVRSCNDGLQEVVTIRSRIGSAHCPKLEIVWCNLVG